MKILITGSNGFIGKNLSIHLEKNHTVYKLKRNAGGIYDNLTILVDLTDTEAIKNKFNNELANLQIDAIIHCAAILTFENDKENLSVLHQNNAITYNLIYLAEKLNVKKVINFSTIGVYPNTDGIYTENSAVKTYLNAECIYALSKFCSEELISYYLKNTKVINIRLSQTYGEGMRNDRIYAIYLKELIENNVITVWGNGERTSNFISINYLLTVIDKIIISNNMEGVYNLGEENISYLQLAQKIIQKFGNSESRIVKLDKGIKSKVVIDCTKINNSLLKKH